MFEIGDEQFPGLSKIVEENGEVAQVIGKLMGSKGEINYWDGTNLRQRLIEKLADLKAAIHFFTVYGLTNEEVLQLNKRRDEKFHRFISWHEKALDEKAMLNLE